MIWPTSRKKIDVSMVLKLKHIKNYKIRIGQSMSRGSCSIFWMINYLRWAWKLMILILKHAMILISFECGWWKISERLIIQLVTFHRLEILGKETVIYRLTWKRMLNFWKKLWIILKRNSGNWRYNLQTLYIKLAKD